ncbi:MAG: copper resistance protein NlpE N-terminal domain-containing protein [Rhizobium sp.]|nr:copper resistance protein NlpE N-terminal domain-containing protein [Rhizobium sp.]
MSRSVFSGFFAFMFAAVLLAGCGRETAPAPEAPPGDAPLAEANVPDDGEAFETAWLGVLPCADCDGIQTRLQLHGDDGERRYELEETYLGAAGDNVFVTEGDWVQETLRGDGAEATVYRLDPQGPDRWFELRPDGSLEMLDGEGRPLDGALAYRLQRL